MTAKLTLALTKGRILKETLPLLARAGIEPAEDIGASRKLIFPTNRQDLQLVVLRGTDVPTYVRLGAADLGVVGKDVLLEHGAEGLYEPLDLGIARCRLMTAGPVGRGRLGGLGGSERPAWAVGGSRFTCACVGAVGGAGHDECCGWGSAFLGARCVGDD